MCGRVHVRSREPELIEEFRELRIQPDLKFLDRYNVTPSQVVQVVRQEADGTCVLEPVTWGLLPAWAKKASEAQSIARAESIASKRTFKDAFQHRRCIIPVNGYYEWQRITPHVKQPWHVYRADHGILSLAGLWSMWPGDGDSEPVETCCIITVAPNEQLATIHDRMPVVLPRSAYDVWLDPKVTEPDVLQLLLVPYPAGELAFDPVSSYVNSPQHDGPKCIEPVKLSRGLFD